MEKKRSRSRHQHAAGFTLLEIMLVLTLAAILILVSTRWIRESEMRADIVTITRMIASVDEVTRSRYTGTFAYPDTLSLLDVWEVLPGDIKGAGAPTSMLTGPWGARVSLASLAGSAGTVRTRFAVTVSTMPTDACIRVLGALGASFQSIQANGTDIKVNSNRALSENEVDSACGVGAGASPTNISFINA